MAISPITLTAATSLKRNVHANGPVLNINNVTGFTITMPAAVGRGDKYDFFVLASVTSGNHVVAALTTDIIQGAVSVTTDIAGVTCPTTATSDKMTMNGGTSGGIKGTRFTLEDVASGCWAVTGALVSTGAEATPFSET